MKQLEVDELKFKWLIKIIIGTFLFFMGVIMGEKTLIKNINIKTQFLENELYYWETKAQIVKEIESFVNIKAPINNISSILIVKYADKYNVDPRLFLSQGFVESHYGTKGLARKTHSICNVGAWDDGTITHRYNHPNESIEPYFKLISKNYLINKSEGSLLKNFVDKNNKRYASYPYYERELSIIWEEINNSTKLDSLLNVYEYYKLELER